MNDYLKKITLNAGDVTQWIRAYLKNMRIVVLLIIALIVGGLVSYSSLPQTVAPEINLTLLVVSASLPGATPEDVEALLTIPLENELKSVDGVDSVSATANSSATSIVMTFVRGVEKDRALADVEAALSRLGELPQGATEPRVEAVDFEDAPIVQWAFSSENMGQTSLSAQMQKLIDALEADQKIDRVISGGQPRQEVQIIITPESIAALGITQGEIREVVSSAVATLPSGTVQGSSLTRSLSIDSSIEDIDSLRTLPITIGSDIIALGEIATIVERPETGSTEAFLSKEGEIIKIVTLDVYRTSGADLSESVVQAQTIMEDFMREEGPALMRFDISNADTQLTEQFTDLMKNLATTVVLVFITLTLFVGRRQALLASLSIPLIYGITFISMQITDISVNFLSLFALTLSLGLLVDVTIVIVSAMTTYMREGNFGAHKTGILVFRDFFVTLVMTTLTTIWAFVPLLLAGGIIGEYIKPIPVIVSSVLISSVFVGFFVILPLMIWLFNFELPRRVRFFFGFIGTIAVTVVFFTILNTSTLLELKYALPLAILGAAAFVIWVSAGHTLFKKVRASKGNFIVGNESKDPSKATIAKKDVPKTIINVGSLQAKYRNALERILLSRVARWKTIGIVTTFFIFACSLVAFGFVKNEFFPGEDSDFFYVAIELPNGSTLEETQGVAQELLPTLSDLEGVEYVTLQGGFGADGEGGTTRTGNNEALFTLMTPTKDEGGLGSRQVSANVREMSAITNFAAGSASVVEAGGGPPAGADVTINFKGDDLAVLRKLALELEQRITDQPLENVSISPENAAAIVAYEPDDYLLAREGLSREQISGTIRLLTTGVTLAEDVEFAGLSDERDIVLKTATGDAQLADIGNVQVQGDNGALPLDTLGSLRLKENITKITREDYDRTVSLTAAIKVGGNLNDVNDNIAEILDDEIRFPRGYAWSSGGANEENNESVASIIQGMGLAAALIFLTLIVHLRSYRKAAIVLLTIPLAISGVFIIFGIIGIPLSFPSLIGILALFGIVVNNAIIIISQINANREVGLSFHESVISGSTSRLEPILLSSMTTIIGLIPITLSDPVWQGLGGAIISGLVFSGTIMLFFIPTVYYIMMRDEDIEKIAQ